MQEIVSAFLEPFTYVWFWVGVAYGVAFRKIINKMTDEIASKAVDRFFGE